MCLVIAAGKLIETYCGEVCVPFAAARVTLTMFSVPNAIRKVASKASGGGGEAPDTL